MKVNQKLRMKISTTTIGNSYSTLVHGFASEII